MMTESTDFLFIAYTYLYSTMCVERSSIMLSVASNSELFDLYCSVCACVLFFSIFLDPQIFHAPSF